MSRARRIVLASAIGLMLAGTTQHCARKEKALQPALRLARNYWPGNYWEDIAVEKGWFREEELNVESIDVNDDYAASLTAVVEGRLDTQNFNLFDLVSRNRKGANLVMVAVTDYSNGADTILARRGINRIGDLRGKRIGVSADTYSEFLLEQALGSESVSNGDVSIVSIQAEKAAAAFRDGLDAVVTFDPTTDQVVAAGGHVIFDSSSLPWLLPSGLPFRREFLERRPQDVEKFVRVFARSTEWMRAHPEETWQIVARRWHVTPEAAKKAAKADAIVDLPGNKTAFAIDSGNQSLHSTFRLMDVFVRKDDHGPPLDSADFIDARFTIHAAWNSRQ
jgi:NitT/TauT family transport system substrate-binding protein